MSTIVVIIIGLRPVITKNMDLSWDAAWRISKK